MSDAPQYKRYRTIDGMRGYASLAVMFYHLGGNLLDELSTWLHPFFIQAIDHGFVGVPVFFVISGFAMAISVNNVAISPKFFGNFVLRRSLRLDPPYWVSIVIALCLLAMKNAYLVDGEPMPTWECILAHVFYLQVLLGYPFDISITYWTLCQEVQLYLVFICLIWLSQRLTHNNVRRTWHVMLGCMLLLGVYSLAADFKLVWRPGVTIDPNAKIVEAEGLFFRYWHYFLIGVLSEKMLRGVPNASRWFVAWLLLEAIVQSQFALKAYVVTAILTGIFLLVAIKTNSLDSWLTDPVSQYLGRISYSLYLIHTDLGWKVISLGKSKLDATRPLNSILILAAGIFASVVAAHIIYLCVEKPAVRLSKRFKKEWPQWTDPT